MPKKTEARSLRELVRGGSALFPDASEPLRSYANDGEWLSDGIYGKIPRGNFLRDMISGSPLDISGRRFDLKGERRHEGWNRGTGPIIVQRSAYSGVYQWRVTLAAGG